MVKFQHSIDFGPLDFRPLLHDSRSVLRTAPGAPGSQQACLRQARARAVADQYFDRGSPARWPSFCAAVIFWHPITLDF